MNMTNHAQIRGQQRGISNLYLSLLYQYGNEEFIHGARRISFDKQQKKRLRKAINKVIESLDKDIYMVLSKDEETVITVAHKI